jgi:hypothetical protein
MRTTTQPSHERIEVPSDLGAAGPGALGAGEATAWRG